MMSWVTEDREAMQKFLRESILQLCRINIGMPGSYEVDGIICITRSSSRDIDGKIDEDQIVVKVHEHITTNVHDSIRPSHLDASILREYLVSNNVPSRMIRNPALANPPLKLKRKANDENDNTVIDISCSNGDRNLLTSVKLLRYDDGKLHCDMSDDRGQMRRPLFHTRDAEVSGSNLTYSEKDNIRSESYSCGSCLLDFDSWVSLQGHFQQSHTSCLEHYCQTCAVGFLCSADLGKHNSSVHRPPPSTAVVGSRRKQNKPKRGVANDEGSMLGDSAEDEMEIFEDGLKLSESQHRNGQNNVTTSTLRPLLEQRPLSKMLREDHSNTAKQELPDDPISTTTGATTTGAELVSERICPHCTSFFADFSTFSIHCQAVHHRFPCPHCLQTFTQRVNRDRHLYNHTGERPFECSACGDGFTRRDVLRKHQVKCNHSVGIADNVFSEQDIDGTVPFCDNDSVPDANTSDECGLDLSVPSDYLRTLKEEPKEAVSAFEVDSEMCLAVASKQSMPKSFMHPHPSSAIVRQSPLPVVSSEWTDVETLVRFQSSGAVDPPSVVPHQPLPEGRWYSCDICRASVTGAAAFELHCRNEHRRTPCVYCGKTFSQKGNMERHQRQHTGERPFACPHCSCSYTRKETLKVHINQAHPDTAASDAAAGSKEVSVEAQSADVSDGTADH